MSHLSAIRERRQTKRAAFTNTYLSIFKIFWQVSLMPLEMIIKIIAYLLTINELSFRERMDNGDLFHA